MPTHLADGRVLPHGIRGSSDEAFRNFAKASRMLHRRAYTVEPSAPITAARRRKGGPAELFGVQAVGRTLRRVASNRQGAVERFRFVRIQKAGVVREVHSNVGGCDWL